MNNDVEILVVGGGPAGLLSAACLAKTHRVALIERGEVGLTTKYWLTSQRRLKKHGLESCVLFRPRKMTVSTFLGGYLETSGDLAVVDEQKLMRILVERCRNQGVLITDHCALLNLNWNKAHITAGTTSSSFKTRLVVDASGGSSPIAKTFKMHKLHGFFVVYGALLRRVTLHSKNAVLAHIEHLGDPPPIVEVFPCGEDAAFCCVFMYSRELMAPERLKAAFELCSRHNSFFDMTENTEIAAAKMGAIAIGRVRRRLLPGVISVGEAGLVQPPLLGSAFNEVLEYSESLCAHVSSLLKNSSGVPRQPKFRYPLIKCVQDRLQLRAIRILLNGNVETFDRLVRFVSKLPKETIYNLCSNELSWREVLSTAISAPYALLRSA
jgi:flavin-dependent dehydrogenase